mgnify:CR=1 FL=1
MFSCFGFLLGPDGIGAVFVNRLRGESEMPMTGMPALRILSTDSRISLPPSSLTAPASVSFMMRTAEQSASFELP